MTMKDQIENAIDKISAIKGVGMEPMYLMLDVLALYSVYSDRFNIVVDEVIKAIEMIVNNPSLGQQLDFSLSDYKSYHFSSPGQLLKVGELPEEDMRIAHRYMKSNKLVEVLGFGHRYLPKVYDEHGNEQ
ncbi:hypothetical protein ACOQFO_16775 [Ureibacillus sp. MALMAid1270]|uniref:hypothetical protein n=1 Tax=Ureibacillus sp. MALMAid1270 TaxID=3411629 RepID=UPI003BA52C30